MKEFFVISVIRMKSRVYRYWRLWGNLNFRFCEYVALIRITSGDLQYHIKILFANIQKLYGWSLFRLQFQFPLQKRFQLKK